jgi:nicotinamidase-related amidase
VTIDSRRTAVLGLHWQVNVIRPEGFFGGMLAEPVARSGVVKRAAAFHDDARAAGLPIILTRFVIPMGEGQLVRNTGFMAAVADAQGSFRPNAPGSQLIDEMSGDLVVDNQKLSGLAGNNLLAWLVDRDIDTLLITGVATNLTVEQTARAATDLGLTVHPISDCAAAATEEIHAASLANLDLTTAGRLSASDALGLLG